jgi:hypothetical protein
MAAAVSSSDWADRQLRSWRTLPLTKKEEAVNVIVRLRKQREGHDGRFRHHAIERKNDASYTAPAA